jgi:hypothetical protein
MLLFRVGSDCFLAGRGLGTFTRNRLYSGGSEREMVMGLTKDVREVGTSALMPLVYKRFFNSKMSKDFLP